MNKDNITMSKQNSSGYLEIILGSMYSGKSTRIVEIYKQCKFCNISVTVINHIIDNRYDDELLSTHDKIKIPCIKAGRLSDIWISDKILDKDISNITRNQEKLLVSTSDVILINEGQFFEDLYEVVRDMVNQKKKVHICALDGDYERKKFGQVLDLIPHCNNFMKLTAWCSLCENGTPGIFSKRITGESIQTVIGSENYIPVCRNCFEKND